MKAGKVSGERLTDSLVKVNESPRNGESCLKGIILPLFTHHHVVPNLYFSSVEQKRLIFRIISCLFFSIE